MWYWVYFFFQFPKDPKKEGWGKLEEEGVIHLTKGVGDDKNTLSVA